MPEAHRGPVEAAGAPPPGAGRVSQCVGAGGGAEVALGRGPGRFAAGPGRRLLIVLVAIGIVVLGVVSFAAPLRAAAILLVALTCPGFAVVRLLRLADPVAELGLAIATSVAIAGLVAGLQLYFGLWSPGLGLVLLLAVTLIALGAEPLAKRLRAAYRRGAAREVGPQPTPGLPADRPPAPFAMIHRLPPATPVAPKAQGRGRSRASGGSDPLGASRPRPESRKAIERNIDELARRREDGRS
jgi:hypothetical protein